VEVVVKATRHVLTTTVTTIAGFVPLLTSGGPFWRPLAIAVAGGIGGSSLLALYFTPALYLLLFGNQGKSKGDRAIEAPAQNVPKSSTV
jgi:multidrug efflux pump subunit AcrB